jgi:hypothetical protein
VAAAGLARAWRTKVRLSGCAASAKNTDCVGVAACALPVLNDRSDDASTVDPGRRQPTPVAKTANHTAGKA